MPLIKQDAAEVVYGKMPGSRWFCLLAMPLIGGLFASLPIMLFPTQRWITDRSPLEIIPRVALLSLIALFGVFMVLLCLYGAGPEDLILDLRTRTYRFRRGFPLLARWQTGPFSDIDTLYIRRQATKGGVFYRLMMGWSGRGRKSFFPLGDGPLESRKGVLLKSGSSLPDMEGEMRAISTTLGIPAEDLNAGTDGLSAEQTRKRSVSIMLWSVAVAFLLLLMISGPDLLIQQQLDTQGKVAYGTVTDFLSNKNSRIAVTYQIADGRTFRGSDRVTRRAFDNMRIGAPIHVIYLPDYPKTCRTDFSDEKRSSLLTLSLYGGWLVLGSLYSLNRLKRKPLG
jgi:hypothetical protein